MESDYKCFACLYRREHSQGINQVSWNCSLSNREVMSTDGRDLRRIICYAPSWCKLLTKDDKKLLNEQFKELGENPIFTEVM